MQRTCVHALVPRLRGFGQSLALSRRTVWPSPPQYKVGNPKWVISELNSPACTPPVNASPPSYEEPTHDSGSRLFATHYRVEDLHLLSFAGFDRRFHCVPGFPR